MKTRTTRVLSLLTGLALATVAVALGTSVYAKVPTVKLTIAGGQLPRELEVTTGRALVDIWTGTRPSESWFDFPTSFIGSVVGEPDRALPRYTVSFFADSSQDRRRPQKLYVVRYVPDPRTGRGFIYLPLQSDPDGGLNGIMVRPGKDGHWVAASAEWSHALNAHLAASVGR